MLISVIIPVYNVENYLRQCLDSVINQTYKNLEIICVDDCSTDSSLEILKEYAKKDERITLLENKVNQGVGVSRNIGFEEANGYYIHFMDPDDTLINQNIYQELINSLTESECPDILHFYYGSHTEDSNHMFIAPQKNRTLYDKVIKPRENPAAYDNWSRYVWTKFYKRRFLKDNNIKFSGIRALSDYRFSADTFVKCETLCYVDKIVVNYTKGRKNSLVSKVINIIGKIYDEFEYNAKLYESLPNDLKYKLLGLDYVLIYDYTERAYNEGRISKYDLIKIQNILKKYNVDKFICTELNKTGKELKIDFESLLNNTESQPKEILISVIIPVYNVEKYLRQCLNSVINQTYQNLEIICVNDASTDSSGEILKEYAQKDSRIKIIENEENLGLGLTRNVGIKAATGDYVHCLDADDWMELNAYQRMIKILSYKPEIEVLHFNYRVYDNIYGYKKDVPIQREYLQYFNEIFDMKKTPEILDLWTTSAWLKIIRRSFILENNLFYNNYKCLEDIEYSLNLILKAKKVFFFPKILLNYRMNRSDSLMSKRFKYLDNIMKDYELALEKSKDLSEEGRKAYLRFINKKVIENYYEAYKANEISLKEIREIINKLDISVFLDGQRIISPEHYSIVTEINREYKKNLENLKIANQYNKRRKQDLLSVIIPVYNVEDFLKICLNSVIEQSYSNLEIICVDDCSTDSCAEILEEYSNIDPRIKIIKHTENKGLGAARNSGLEAATGSYVHFLDSDDWIIDKDAYQDLMKSVKEFNNPDILHFWFRYSQLTSHNCWIKPQKNKELFNKVINPRENTDSIDNWERYVWAKLFRKDFLESNNIKFSLIRSMEDLEYSAETFTKCKTLCYVDKIIINYTVNRLGSLVAKSHTVLNEIVEVFKSNAKLYESLPDKLKYEFLGLDYYQVRTNLLKAYNFGLINKADIKRIKRELSSFEIEKFTCSDLKPEDGELQIDFASLLSKPRCIHNILLSVIIPVYNVEKYLHQCLDSVINQTYRDLEIICVNDASTDSSGEILKEYAQNDSRIKIVNMGKNSGSGIARNKGLEVATGRYIHFLDSDDYISNNECYQKVIEKLNKLPEPDILHFHFKYFKDDPYLAWSFSKKNKEILNKIIIPRQSVEAFDNWERYVWTKFYRRKFLIDNKIVFNEQKSLQDYKYSADTFVNCNSLCYLEDEVVSYRNERPGSMALQAYKVLPAIMDAFKYNAKLYEILPDKLKYKLLGADYYQIRHNIETAYSKGFLSEKDLRKIEKDLEKYDVENYIYSTPQQKDFELKIDFKRIISEIKPKLEDG